MRRIVLQSILVASVCVASPATGSALARSGPAPDAAPLVAPPVPPSVAPQLDPAASSLAPPSSREQQRLVTRAPRPGEAAQSLQQSSDRSTLSQITAMALPLTAVLALIAGCAWVFRKLQASTRGGFSGPAGAINAPSGIVSVLGRYSLNSVGSPRQNLLLLQVDRRVLLIGQTLPARGQPGSLATLCELVEPEDVASVLIKVSEAEQSGPAGRFSAMLQAGGHPTDGESGRLSGLNRLLSRLTSRSNAPVSWSEQPSSPFEPAEAAPLASRRSSSVRARLNSITNQPPRSPQGVA